MTDKMIEHKIKDRADWLVDAVATATQNRMFLRGEPECDDVACVAIQMNGEKAMQQVTGPLQARILADADAIKAAKVLAEAVDFWQTAEEPGVEEAINRLTSALTAFNRAKKARAALMEDTEDD